HFLEHSTYKRYVLKKALKIWKQLGNKFVESADILTNWWMSVELKKNEDHIKTLAIRIHSISPHNTACELKNAKSELNYIDQNFHKESFLSIFNKIASSIENGTNLFDSDSVSLEELVEDTEDMEESSEEINDFVGKNLLNLKIGNLISLSFKLEFNELLNEEVVHDDKNFNVNDLINDSD
ncbi:29763_t:CDS:2, partial [Racocetra persica]